MHRFPLLKLSLCLLAVFLLTQVVKAEEQVSQRAPYDYDGDHKSDLTVFRPVSGTWYILQSQTQTVRGESFGVGSDKIVSGDFDGDGKDDLAVFRPTNQTWYLQRSRDGFQAIQFGLSGDQPFTGYFDGDAKADLAVIRADFQGNLTWFILQSTGGVSQTAFGTLGDIPVRGDFDGDGRSDIAVWRPSNGGWYYLRSTNNTLGGQTWGQGSLGDMVGAGDYDGDGKTDLAVWRSATGVWYVLKSLTNTTASVQFGGGVYGDVPVPADYDGDGKADYAVWRPSAGAWYYLGSTAGFVGQYFGSQALGDRQAPSAFDSTATLTGTVKDNTGAAISGALVEVTIQGVLKASTTTSSSGTFYIPGMAAGRYEVKASRRNAVTSSSCNVTAYLDAKLTGIDLTAAGITNTNLLLETQTICADDDFGDGVFAPVWTSGLIGQSGNSAVTIAETNQRLEATVPVVSGANSTYNGIRSLNTYDLRDKVVTFHMISQGVEDQGLHRIETRLDVGPSAANHLQLAIGDNGITLSEIINNGTSEVLSMLYNQTTQGYVRLRIKNDAGNSGVLLFVETSPMGDDGTWSAVNAGGITLSNSDFTLTNATISLNSGSYNTNATVTKTIVDDFRVTKFDALSANAGDDKTAVNNAATLSGTYTCTGCTGTPSGLGYSWTLVSKPNSAPDPTISSPTSASTGVAFTYPGYYNFRLGVTGTYNYTGSNQTSTSYDIVRVYVPDAPVGAFATTGTVESSGTIAIKEGEPIVFDAAGSQGAYEYRWQFGDGHEAEIARATHVYMTPATYTVTLTVKNEAGAVSTAITKTVRVDAIPDLTTVVTPTNNATLQAAIDAAASQSTRTDINLIAGTDYGTIVLRTRAAGNTGYITIKSDQMNTLPTRGHRVSAVSSTHIGAMPRISTTTIGPAMTTEAAAHHYRFLGVLFRRAPNSTATINPLVQLADPSASNLNLAEPEYQTVANQPHHLIFDRCVFSNTPDPTGTPTAFHARRGLQLDAANVSVLNSDFREFKETGVDSQAISSWAGLGPHAIVNNYLEAVTENILYGGSTMTIFNGTPSDITIRGNYFFKPDRWETNGEGPLKNLLELKHARNVIIDGNVMQNSFTEGNQRGTALVITVRDEYDDNPWTTIEHVQFSNNKVLVVGRGFNILGQDNIVTDPPNPHVRRSVAGRDIMLRNNLWTYVGATAGSDGWWGESTLLPNKVWLIHNTVINWDTGSAFHSQSPLLQVDSGFRLDNNLFKRGLFGIFSSDGQTREGTDFLNTYVPGWSMRGNVMAVAHSDAGRQSFYPAAQNSYFVDMTDDYQTFQSQFINWGTGDYHLTASSLGHNFATDGTDSGCNIDAVNSATSGSISGVW